MIRVKICGLTNPGDVRMCARAGADALGFVVEYPEPVPWNLSAAGARELMAAVPPFVTACLVLGGAPEHQLALAEELHPGAVQLHGEETLEQTRRLCRALRRMGIMPIKALRISPSGCCAGEEPDPLRAARLYTEAGVAALVLDAQAPGRPGGTGIPIPMAAARAVLGECRIPVILAGGLRPENVAARVADLRPYGVDVLTGVEKSPGHKDPERVRAFLAALGRQ